MVGTWEVSGLGLKEKAYQISAAFLQRIQRCGEGIKKKGILLFSLWPHNNTKLESPSLSSSFPLLFCSFFISNSSIIIAICIYQKINCNVIKCCMNQSKSPTVRQRTFFSFFSNLDSLSLHSSPQGERNTWKATHQFNIPHICFDLFLWKFIPTFTFFAVLIVNSTN